MVELPYRRIEEVRAHFPGAQAQMALASIADGNTAARCWTYASGAIVLWDRGNEVFYLAGEETSEAVAHELAALFAHTIWPAAAQEGLRYFTARARSPQMERVLPQIFGTALHPTVKRFYVYARDDAAPLHTPTVQGFEFTPIDERLLRNTHIENVEAVANEVRWMWPSLERYYANGFGVAVKWGDRLVCWCTAEYVSRTRCGIGIETIAEFQGKGIATAAATRFVAECRARGIQPHWECNAGNAASARVAEKAGFSLVEESTYWAGSPPQECTDRTEEEQRKT